MNEDSGFTLESGCRLPLALVVICSGSRRKHIICETILTIGRTGPWDSHVTTPTSQEDSGALKHPHTCFEVEGGT